MTKIQEAIEIVGSVRRMANILGVSEPTVSHWKSGKKALPAGRVLAVAAATNWVITPHELNPDVYPNPTDGISM